MKAAVSRLVHDAPGYWWPRAVGHGAVHLGRLGWQHLKHRVRSGVTGVNEFAWQRDGIVVLESFLPGPTFDLVLAEYAEGVSSGRPRREWTEGGVHNDALVVPLTGYGFPATQNVAASSALRGFVEGFAGRSIEYLPQTVSFLKQTAVAWPQTDGNAFLHADVHYPTVKAVLYLNDVRWGGGAFMYARGSHRVTLRRLSLEYRLALRQRAGAPPRLLEDEQAKLDVQYVTAPANTLIVADHCGFHARGPLEVGRTRLTLRMSFRYLESPRYRLRRLLGMPSANKAVR